MKRRILCLMASLLLCGAASAQNGWDTNPNSHNWSSNTPIVATVSIEGIAQTDLTNLTLGAFAGDELRGRANVANHSVVNNSVANDQFWIQVFYNYNTTEAISFKLYDAATQTEYSTCAVTKPTQDEGWGTYANPIELNFTNAPQTETQTIVLAAGWNWVSFNVVADDLLAQLEAGLGDNGIMIEGRDGTTENLGDGFWLGDLDDFGIELNQMYFVQTTTECEIAVQGMLANSTEFEITINPGWNWIGFPMNEELTILNVEGFEPEENDLIEGSDGVAEYLGDDFWLGEIDTLIPGHGYMYFSNSNQIKTLRFQVGAKNRH